ncbi:hypothetical protein [Pyrobaculum aerophilum]|uniref:hypothetical protein n=1 Tax=Pyrobaculum aerophilum TaxID=13773 RepID=UPI0028687F1F|nr:hypothetical protein [Pyrobaculum aerophilum]
MVNWINDQDGLDCGGKKVKVRLIYRDSESKLELAQSITEALITQDKVHFLLSPYGSDLALGVSPIAEDCSVGSSGVYGLCRHHYVQLCPFCGVALGDDLASCCNSAKAWVLLPAFREL